MSPRILLTLVGLVPASCATRPTAPLANFGESQVLLQVGFKPDGSVLVTVNVISKDPRCPGVTDDAWAEVAGHKLGVNQRGGAAENKGGAKFCQPSIFSGTVSHDEAAAVPVLVGDSSATWTVQVTRMLAARQLVITQPANGHLQRGVSTSINVGESTDGTATGDVFFVGQADGATAFSLSLAEPAQTTVTGTNVTFTVPLNAPVAAGSLSFAGDLSPAIQACTGPTTCSVAIGLTLTTSTSIDS